VPRLVLAPRALGDLERLADFLLEHSPVHAAATAALIVEALDVLKGHPLIGRPVEAGLHELVISRGRTGHVALYRYQVEHDRALVLAIRHQRELQPAVAGDRSHLPPSRQ
jgi:plasmid stabilization system protein ParE